MMQGRMIAMTMNDGAQIGVYHVEPKGTRRGGLVLVQEIFGVTDHIRETCDGYAADGYEVLSPSLYDREQRGFEASYSPEDIQKGRALRDAHPFDLSLADCGAMIDALKTKGPVFITGYCYGGSVTWAAACRCEGLSAASAYYGSMIPQMAEWQPKCPTILHFGRDDLGIPLDAVEKVAKLHPDVQVYVYDAGHGFNSDRRSDYNETCARLARQRTLDLFRSRGG